MSLLEINVNDHVEKKGNLSYLSWAWAWAEVLKIDPLAEWVVVEYTNADHTASPCMWIGDTAMVKTVVTINGKARACQLPVMDHKNNAVKNPDSRKISDAIMRCMTKAISMHGLGLYIYAGEDLPEGAEVDPPAIDLKRTDRLSPSAQAKRLTDEAAKNIQRVATALSDMPSGEMEKIWEFIPVETQDKLLAVWPATA